jgi:hypothetical protein
MSEPIADLWEERALPILRYIAANETDMGFISIGDLSTALGIDGHALAVELERLIDAGYIPGELQMMGAAIQIRGFSQNHASPSVARAR